MSHTARLALAGIAVALLTPARSDAQLVMHEWSGEQGESFFGRSVAALGDLDGDGPGTVAVGDPSGAGFAGRVNLYASDSGELLLSLAGAVPGQEFGAALSAVGDLDGDGVADLAVGSPLDSTAGPSAGRVNWYSGADGSLLRSLDGDAADTYFGAALAPLGDLDGDGVAELLVGAPREGPDQSGRVWVIDGADGTPWYSVAGLGKDDFLGTAVAAVGDVNGDGVPDLIAGAPESAAQPGYVLVCSGVDGTVLRELHGDHPGDAFGSSVAGIGDLDGDGHSELVVGVPGLDLGFEQAGGVVVFSSADGGVLQFHSGDGPWAGLGFSVTGPGDVDGDGVPDVAAGTDRIEGGEVLVWRGSDGGLLAVVPVFDEGDRALGSGVVVVPAGDVDGDGLRDLLVGVPSRLVSADPGTARLVRVSVKPWLDLGGALAGALGEPELVGEGSLVPGTTYVLQLSSAMPLAQVSLVMGFTTLLAPFKGGVLVPSPDVLQQQLGADAEGRLTVVGQLPPQALAGTTVVFQLWVTDPAGPVGLSGSNALQATVAP